MELKPWKLLDSKDAFKNKWWHIVQETVELPDGTVTDDYWVNHTGGAVAVLALTEDGRVLVNRQYKHGVREVVHELTIGRIDGDDDGALEEAKRELLEETGYGGGDWEALGMMVSNPTSSTSRLHTYLARGVRKLAEPKKDPKEIVEVREIAPGELLRMAFAGELETSPTLAIVLLAAKRLGWISETV